MTFLNTYYRFKPLIPRRLQLCIRRLVAARKRSINKAVWPIDPEAGRIPSGWTGWPGNKQFALVLNHDVDTARGRDKCGFLMEIERSLGFHSSFFFVPEGYTDAPELRSGLEKNGFEVGVHGLRHDGKMFNSRKIFEERVRCINEYLKGWGAVGFSSPSMHRKLDWMGALDITYDISTFDTDPFEPQPEGVKTIFPFWVPSHGKERGFVELPYTLPQDHCLFIILRESDNRLWKEKLDWIAAKGGMALLNSHPDYMNFGKRTLDREEYPVAHYSEFLNYVKIRYEGRYWHPLSREMAAFWEARFRSAKPADDAMSALRADAPQIPDPIVSG